MFILVGLRNLDLPIIGFLIHPVYPPTGEYSKSFSELLDFHKM